MPCVGSRLLVEVRLEERVEGRQALPPALRRHRPDDALLAGAAQVADLGRAEAPADGAGEGVLETRRC